MIMIGKFADRRGESQTRAPESLLHVDDDEHQVTQEIEYEDVPDMPGQGIWEHNIFS